MIFKQSDDYYALSHGWPPDINLQKEKKLFLWRFISFFEFYRRLNRKKKKSKTVYNLFQASNVDLDISFRLVSRLYRTTLNAKYLKFKWTLLTFFRGSQPFHCRHVFIAVIANLLACTENISRITKSVAYCIRPVYKYAFIKFILGFLRQNWERVPLVYEDLRWENKVQRKYLSSVLFLTICNRQHFYRNFRPFTRG